jgi:GNAT superfamily N-acetyltransferase
VVDLLDERRRPSRSKDTISVHRGLGLPSSKPKANVLDRCDSQSRAGKGGIVLGLPACTEVGAKDVGWAVIYISPTQNATLRRESEVIDLIIEHAPAEIAASLVGALAAWLLVTALNRLKDYRLRRRYPLSGHYLSQYEDVVDGVNVVRKAGVEFSQRGLQLSGMVTNLDDNRGWRMRLTIDPAGFLQGLYWAELPGDPGTGVVFLQREPGDGLVGIWAGYDSRNLRVEGGKWTFHRQVAFDVTRLHPYAHESADALEILRTELGERYITSKQFTEFLRPGARDSRTGVWVAAEKPTERTIGVLLAEEVDDQGMDETLHGRRSELQSSPQLFRLKNRSRALIKSVAVAPNYQGKGVATALVKQVMRDLEAMGIHGFYALGWIRKDRAAIQGVLEPLGFRPVGDLDRFWHDESEQQGYECPDCGNPCICAARLLISA